MSLKSIPFPSSKLMLRSALLAVLAAALLVPGLTVSAATIIACQNESVCPGGSCPSGQVCARQINNDLGCCVVSNAFCTSSCVTPQPWFKICPSGFCGPNFSAAASRGSGAEEAFVASLAALPAAAEAPEAAETPVVTSTATAMP